MSLPAFFIGSFPAAQSQPVIYAIAPWFNDKQAAVSLTFDDGISGQFEIAVPLLNQHDFKATFFVTTHILISQLGNWQLVKEAAAAGHEIANHALTHPHFDSISAESITKELIESNALIEENIKPFKSLTHAYPFGGGGQETASAQGVRELVKKYFIGARAVRNKDIPYNKYRFAVTDDDYFKVNSDMIADSAAMADFSLHLDAAIAAGGWYVPCYHGIENGWIIVPKNIFEQHLQELEKRKAVLWIAPFADVIKYHKERNSAILFRHSYGNRSFLVLSLEDTLKDASTWNQPLTIHLKKITQKIISIRQGGKDILFLQNGDEVIFNARPGKDRIIIAKK